MNFLAELRRRWWLALLVVFLFLLLFATRAARFYTDILWFSSLGYLQVFWRLLATRIGLAVVAGAVMAVLVAVNLLLARRLAPMYRIPTAQEEGIERYRQAITPHARPVLLGIAVVIGVLSGASMVGEWDTYLLWANGGEFGRVDPHFGRDLGFFVFTLPFYSLVNSWLFTSLALVIVLTAAAHYLFGGIRPQSPGQKVSPQANVHLSILLALLVAVRGWGFVLDQYQLSYSTRGTVTGLSYTDVRAQLIAYQLLAVIAAVVVVLFLLNIRYRNYLLPAAGVGILLVAAIVLSGIYPAVIQRLQVDPQELPRERPYIERNLELTRYGFGLTFDEQVEFRPFAADDALTREQIDANSATLESMRLWDPATLQNTYQQLQALRTYYQFRDVDVDRYVIDGKQRQVMISVRELNERELPPSARTWQNQRLVYTHGYGLVSSEVSSKTSGGQPVFLARDIPPQGEPQLAIENPRIYFGENPPVYSIVRTQEQELDYPLPQGSPELFRYDGEDGVDIGGMLRRLAFALRFAEPNFVLSNLITDESRVLMHRHIRTRAELVAPFARFDHDPYPVAADGRIKWILDGYTTSDMLPYSQRVDMSRLTLSEQRVLIPGQDAEGNIVLREDLQQRPGLQGVANYIRNSVKVVIDAYDGTITLYAVDPDDPVLQAWERAFPGVLTSVEEASDELISHFRYPEDMFRIQSALFRDYHIPAADQFYTREDAWRIPEDPSFAANQGGATGQRRRRDLRPYYLLLRLPGEDEPEFALIQPFTPAGEERRNLIAWLAGRSDPEHYGELRAYQMPPTKTVIGPEQAQALINQDERVAQQITLWNQSGSRVIYGNLLVIPVGDALVYAQPLFLRAEQSEIPELQRVVLVIGDRVVMEPTLAEALAALFGEVPEGVRPPPEAREDQPGAQPDDVDPRVVGLIRQALERFAAAEQALRAGDLAGYQQATSEAEQLLRQAQDIIDAGGGQAGGGQAGGGAEGAPAPSPEPQPEESPAQAAPSA